ncbi:hypothetical protein QS257_14725 [Terrilactibacillus sp. S3-3]|nr:hypothetical protein QS257_14725 [Terrilactibacillus sp. S3-3]
MIILIAFLGINLSANAYYKHLGFTQNNMFKMPSTHWIMMGLSKNGGYNNYDYALTRVQPNQQAKKQADFSEIEKRIKEKKGPGLIYLWGVKTARTWAVGTRGYYWYAYISNTRTLIYEYLFSHQKQLMLFISDFSYRQYFFS